MTTASLVDLERELGSKSLRHYLEMMWPYVEPSRPFQANWHHDVLCEHLEAVTRRQIKRLVINVPPGTTKSLVCSVAWPTWSWTHEPGAKWITSSYADRIALRDALRSRNLMMRNWYRDRWGHLWKPQTDKWSSKDYRNNQAGFRMGTTVAGVATGEHADYQLVDDPIKPLDARGDRVDAVKLIECITWWDETMSTRMTDPETAVRVIIMQRIHDRDLSAHVLGKGEYTHLCLPMEAERRCCVQVPHRCSMDLDGRGRPTEPTELGFKDPRSDGILLWPERFPRKVVEMRKRELGSRAAAAQDQQRPQPAGGGIFKEEWFRYWEAQPKGPGVIQIQSWDCAFKGLDTSDFVVGTVWAARRGEYFLLDLVRRRMTFGETCRAILALSAKWPKAIRKLIEDKANGSAVMDHLHGEIPGLIAVEPEGGKVARANAVAPMLESGNVYIPKNAPWLHDFIDEVINFSGDPGRHDDQVDSMTQALVYLYKPRKSAYAEAMKRIAG